MRTMLRSKVTLLFLAFAVMLAVGGTALALTTDGSGTTTAASPTIQSDKADYAPAELVTLTGGGWQSGESVNIKVNDTYGASWSRNVDVTADASGNVTDSFNLPDWFVSDYDVTATGASGAIAKTTFTDAASLTLSPASGLAGTTTVNVTSGGGAYDSNATDIGIYWDGTLGSTNGTLVDTCSANNGGNIIAGSGCSFTVPAGSTVGPHTVVSTQISKPGISAATAFNVTAPPCTAASVTTNPTNQTVTYGAATATFSATGAGNPAPGVQWQVSTNNGTSYSDVSGATSTTLTINNPSVSQSNNLYRAVFTNTCNGTKTATSTAAKLTVNQATPTVNINWSNSNYDGNPNAATATVSGVGSPAEDLGSADTYTYYSGNAATGTALSGAPTNAGTYTVKATYGGLSPNYAAAADATKTITIAQATPTIDITWNGSTYNGNPNAATADVKGVGGTSIGSADSLTYYSGNAATGTALPGAPTNAGTYTVKAAYGGLSPNYAAATDATKTITIAQATASVSITWNNVTYDGNAHPASGSVSGVGSPAENLGQPSFTYYSGSTATGTPLSGAPVNAGIYTVKASFAGNNNYNPASATKTISILFDYSGFLQPINDTAHQTGLLQSKFKLGQTIPVKFQLRDAAGNLVQQLTNPIFTKSANRGACDAATTVETPPTVTPDPSNQYIYTGGQYHYNWSTKGLTAGEYRIYANLADGTQPYVDICLTK